MRKIIRSFSMVIVSAILVWLGIIVVGHQSSSAFELAIALWFFALIHWIFWQAPKQREPHNE